MSNLQYMITQDAVTLINGTNYYNFTVTGENVSKGALEKFKKIVLAIQDNDIDLAVKLFEDRVRELDWSLLNSEFVKYDSTSKSFVFGDNQSLAVNKDLEAKLELILDEEGDVEPLAKFIEKVVNNPSPTSRDSLLRFVSANNLPFTNDGDIIAWKIVDSNYKDHYSGKFDNSVGQKLEMARSKVNPDINQTCSMGFHVCSIGYLKSHGYTQRGNLMICKVNPEDFVAVPTDYQDSKARVCSYEVIGELNDEYKEKFFNNPEDPICENVWGTWYVDVNEIDKISLREEIVSENSKEKASAEDKEAFSSDTFDILQEWDLYVEEEPEEEDDFVDRSGVYMTVEGVEITNQLVLDFVNDIREMVDYGYDYNIQRAKEFFLDRGFPLTKRMPSRVIEKLRKTGVLYDGFKVA